MNIEFDLGPLRVSARYRPAVPGRRVGHPDNWTEGEPEEIDVLDVIGELPEDEIVTEADIELAATLAAYEQFEKWRDRYFAEREIAP